MQLSIRRWLRNPGLIQRVRDREVRHVYRTRSFHGLDAGVPPRDRRR